MISTKEAPLYFFEYLLDNFEEFVEERFYTNYQNQLDKVFLDRENKTIVYLLSDDNNESIKHEETEASFLTNYCSKEYYLSVKLIEEQVNKLVSLNGNTDVYLTLIENKLLTLFEDSSNFGKFSLKHFIQLLIFDFNKKYSPIYEPKSDFTTLVKLITSITVLPKKDSKTLSFHWKQEQKKLVALYLGLSTAQPPFLQCEKETFIKAFSKGELHINEGIRWICFQDRNTTQPSYVTLYRFIDLLFQNNFLQNSDYNDINKIIEHIFLSPTGEIIKNKIKFAKREKSTNPARFLELKKLVLKL
jgi:hypothetical protein